MRAVVVCESVYGNTHLIADAELLVAGGPARSLGQLAGAITAALSRQVGPFGPGRRLRHAPVSD
jgi:hypothetical protein